MYVKNNEVYIFCFIFPLLSTRVLEVRRNGTTASAFITLDIVRYRSKLMGSTCQVEKQKNVDKNSSM